MSRVGADESVIHIKPCSSNQEVEETKSAHESGVAGTGPDGGGGSATGNADQVHQIAYLMQLAQCLEVGLPYDVRQRRVCSAAARLGKPGLLEFAKANRCGWTPATCAEAARGGHLRILKRLRGQGCGWDANTCRQAATGGHLQVLKWARSNWIW
ncbi:conserved unknown protein [Ectocarpus siliculosus]|uniref:Uncharacterized protein n=1 Tax=Ectocarpus siliculosus TaxID=2880 RepID=D7G2P3_ECTSI|nr:conserved unknown protein [Ectocarpus siliculosus]|eukprot:CBJ26868.1 conserved unknown protein [Ectocarpus siliculosus]